MYKILCTRKCNDRCLNINESRVCALLNVQRERERERERERASCFRICHPNVNNATRDFKS